MLTIYHTARAVVRAAPRPRISTSPRARTGPGADDRRRLMAIMDLGGRQPWGRVP